MRLMQQGRGEGAKGLHIRYRRLRSSPVMNGQKKTRRSGGRAGTLLGVSPMGTQSVMVSMDEGETGELKCTNHQRKMSCGRTPMQMLEDRKQIWQEKFVT